MKNVTITLDEDVAAWVRVWAAEHGRSVSRFIGDLLQQRMQEVSAYETAMHQYLSKRPTRLRITQQPLPARGDLYDRAVLR